MSPDLDGSYHSTYVVGPYLEASFLGSCVVVALPALETCWTEGAWCGSRDGGEMDTCWLQEEDQAEWQLDEDQEKGREWDPCKDDAADVLVDVHG